MLSIASVDISERETIKQRFIAAIEALPEACLPFAGILTEAIELHTKKSRDYGSSTDPYANARACEDFGIPAWLGVEIRATDKVRRIQAYARTGTLVNEGVEDSMIDLVVYGAIGLLLFREARDAQEKLS